ncbi:hypothetical protein COLO4_20127 [Corchorus olitorius]|uniref:Uncharacterized protein n=1 Tax=Corchorus olitorius TaxID=93759 RepID=A0A1R3J1H3_9ROSI|nr:hypothetical protein COLO4_20127 [Corchorus olitorius]
MGVCKERYGGRRIFLRGRLGSESVEKMSRMGICVFESGRGSEWREKNSVLERELPAFLLVEENQLIRESESLKFFVYRGLVLFVF